MKTAPLAIALLLLGAVPARAGLELHEEQSRKGFARSGLQVVSVENSRGKTEFLPATGDSIVVVAIKTARGRDAADAARLARATRVDVERERGALVLKVRYPEVRASWSWFHIDLDVKGGSARRRGVQMKIVVHVPQGLEARGRSASGDVASAGVASPQRLESTSGDVRVEDARGPLDARTTSGDIVIRGALAGATVQTVSGDVRASGLRGASTVRSTSGDLVVSEAEGALEIGTVSGEVIVRGAPEGLVVGTTSGDVTARGVARRVQVSASSGEIDVELLAPMESADLSTASGDVLLRLGSQVACALEARTGSGDINVETELRVRSVGRHLVAGTIGGGTAPVRVRTSSGEIRVLREGDQR